MAIERQDLGRVHRIATFTVENTGTESNLVTADQYGMFQDLLIICPAAITGTITLEVLASEDLDETLDASWRDLYQEGNAVDMVAGAAIMVPVPPGPALRLKCGSAQAAERVFYLWGKRTKVS